MQTNALSHLKDLTKSGEKKFARTKEIFSEIVKSSARMALVGDNICSFFLKRITKV